MNKTFCTVARYNDKKAGVKCGDVVAVARTYQEHLGTARSKYSQNQFRLVSTLDAVSVGQNIEESPITVHYG
jgi:hypothetical protein